MSGAHSFTLFYIIYSKQSSQYWENLEFQATSVGFQRLYSSEMTQREHSSLYFWSVKDFEGQSRLCTWIRLRESVGHKETCGNRALGKWEGAQKPGISGTRRSKVSLSELQGTWGRLDFFFSACLLSSCLSAWQGFLQSGPRIHRSLIQQPCELNWCLVNVCWTSQVLLLAWKANHGLEVIYWISNSQLIKELLEQNMCINWRLPVCSHRDFQIHRNKDTGKCDPVVVVTIIIYSET